MHAWCNPLILHLRDFLVLHYINCLHYNVYSLKCILLILWDAKLLIKFLLNSIIIDTKSLTRAEEMNNQNTKLSKRESMDYEVLKLPREKRSTKCYHNFHWLIFRAFFPFFFHWSLKQWPKWPTYWAALLTYYIIVSLKYLLKCQSP